MNTCVKADVIWLHAGLPVAGMDVTPTNEVERGFTIGVVIFALVQTSGFEWKQQGVGTPSSFACKVGFAYVVGSITASLGQLRAMSEEACRECAG